MEIIVNNKPTNFNEGDFPMLISGADKTGTSFFSISLLANLLKHGKQVLLFSAYPMAKEEFRKQIGDDSSQAIIIESGEEDIFIEVIRKVLDLDKRVVLIKNIEQYSAKLFNAVRDLKSIIFSGDLDKCEFAGELLKKEFTTKIFFSPSSKCPDEEVINLPKYHGKIDSSRYQGLICLK